jgi:2'-5' RNA ligase
VPHRLRRPRPPLPRFAVAWFPDFAGMERIEDFRQRHDPMASLVPAHLALVFPFATAQSALQVETHVQRVVSRHPPIAIAFRPVRVFANEFVFLMATRGAAAVVELHDRLYTRSLRPQLRTDLGYEPHITLARNAELARVEAAYAEAQELFGGEVSGVLRAVTVLAVGQDGRIERLKDIALNTA